MPAVPRVAGPVDAEAAVPLDSRPRPWPSLAAGPLIRKRGPVSPTWSYGDIVVRREISWGQPCLAIPVYVVQDSEDLLATYIAQHAPFSFADVPWPTETGRHPWWPRSGWSGHGTLMLQRPGEAYAVFLFWEGVERRFAAWYLNLQDPFRRTAIGYDTEDHELDVVVLRTGEWFFKDEDALAASLRRGRYAGAAETAIRRQGADIAEMLDHGKRWWDKSWADWVPDPSWAPPAAAPQGWASVPWSVER